MATINELNDLIKCHLCGGYLIDATTIIECLHSFCRTCIVNHIDSNTPKSRLCPYPKCELQIHKTKPKLNIRSDPTLQDIVYKIVPGLFKNEMDRRKEFYAREPQSAIGLSNEERGIISGERLIFTPHDTISLSIEYFPQVICYSLLPFSKCLGNGALNSGNVDTVDSSDNQRRYLQCEGGMRVLHLKKWLRSKYELKDTHDIEIMYKHDPLLDEYTMMDLAYIYSWRRNGPLCLYYKIIEPQPQQQLTKYDLKTTEHATTTTSTTQSSLSFAASHHMLAKRSHTFKHKHNSCGSVLAISKKKKKIKKKMLRKNGLNGVTNGLVHESNLITTNPVNEPLTPVDTSLINKVVANNISAANIELINSIASIKQKIAPNNTNITTNSNSNTSPTNNNNSNTKQLIRVI